MFLFRLYSRYHFTIVWISFPHLVTAFLSSPHVKNKDRVKWAAGEQV